MKISIQFENYYVEAELSDTPTGKAIYNCLPFDGGVNTWGDEIYFETPANAPLEANAKAEVEIGDLAYWPTMPAFCVFFGRTPVSYNEKPRAASEVNVFGKLINFDIDNLRKVRSGSKVEVSKI